MATKSRLRTVALVISIPVIAVMAGVAGLFIYVSATAVPIHPEPAVVPSAAASAPASKWTAAAEQGRQIARAAVSAQNLPGLSVAVGAGGEIVWAEGFGYGDLDRKTTVTPATRFKIGEVSIPLTSAVAGLLLEQNQLM